MNYIDLYKRIKKDNPNASPRTILEALVKVYRSTPLLKKEINKWLKGDVPNYSVTLEYAKEGRNVVKEIDYKTLTERNKMEPLQALLYLDWLRRDPGNATRHLKVDHIEMPSREEFLDYIDPALAQKLREREKQDFKVEDLEIANNEIEE